MQLFNKIILALFLACAPLLTAADELIDLSPAQVEEIKQSKALIIDIRTEQEWQSTGIIPGSQTLQFFDAQGQADPQQWLQQMQKLRSSPEQPVVLVCRSGNRSRMVGDFLTRQAGMKNIYHLQNGLKSWLQQGKATEPVCKEKTACNQTATE